MTACRMFSLCLIASCAACWCPVQAAVHRRDVADIQHHYPQNRVSPGDLCIKASLTGQKW